MSLPLFQAFIASPFFCTLKNAALVSSFFSETSVISKSCPTSFTQHSSFLRTLFSSFLLHFSESSTFHPRKSGLCVFSEHVTYFPTPVLLCRCSLQLRECSLLSHSLCELIITLLFLPHGHSFLRNDSHLHYFWFNCKYNFNRSIKNWLLVNTFWRQVKRSGRKGKQ